MKTGPGIFAVGPVLYANSCVRIFPADQRFKTNSWTGQPNSSVSLPSETPSTCRSTGGDSVGIALPVGGDGDVLPSLHLRQHEIHHLPGNMPSSVCGIHRQKAQHAVFLENSRVPTDVSRIHRADGGRRLHELTI